MVGDDVDKRGYGMGWVEGGWGGVEYVDGVDVGEVDGGVFFIGRREGGEVGMMGEVEGLMLGWEKG